MLRLIALSCLLTGTAALQRYYCNSSGVDAIRNSSFYLYTHDEGRWSYPMGRICEFNAIAGSNSTFLVEILYFEAPTAFLTISSGGRILFNGSSLPAYQRRIATPSDSLQVRLDATRADYSKYGALIQVQVLNTNECPPRWSLLHGNCYGTGIVGDEELWILNYTNAQKACNSMRSNLLIVPLNFNSKVNTFFRTLTPTILSRQNSYTWIGLTDRTRQHHPYWLDGVRQDNTSRMRCRSYDPYGKCYTTDRCGSFFQVQFAYQISVNNCSSELAFACSMPLGGTDVAYAVPSLGALQEPPQDKFWIWVLLAGLLVLGVGLLVVGLLYRARANRAVAGASAAASSHGPGSTPPAVQYPVEDPVHYPVQHPVQHPLEPSCPPPPQAPPVFSIDLEQLPPPPSYSDVMGNYQHSTEWQQQAREK